MRALSCVCWPRMCDILLSTLLVLSALPGVQKLLAPVSHMACGSLVLSFRVDISRVFFLRPSSGPTQTPGPIFGGVVGRCFAVGKGVIYLRLNLGWYFIE